jgi:membrane-associated phospholipid phosphatase
MITYPFRAMLARLFLIGTLTLVAPLTAARAQAVPPGDARTVEVRPGEAPVGEATPEVAEAEDPLRSRSGQPPDTPGATPPSPAPAPSPAPTASPEPTASPAPTAAQELPKETPPAGPPPPHTGVGPTIKAIPGDFAHLPSWYTFWTLGTGGALALTAHQVDDDVNTRLKGNDFVHAFFQPGKILGSAPAQLVFVTGLYAYGRATNNRKVSHLGMDLLRSSFEVGTLTYGVKLAVQRKRPNGNCCAFPSGHASVTFSTATVLWRHLGWKAALPTYTVATYVALSRLHENVHFLSDVVFGASLGLAVGHTVTRHGRTHYTWTPVVVPGGVMVAVTGSR